MNDPLLVAIATGTIVNLIAIFWRTSLLATKVEVVNQVLTGRGGVIERVEHLEERFNKEIEKADNVHKDYDLKLQDHARRIETMERRTA